MKRLLNTLYVQTQGARLSKDGANVVVSVEGAERARVPLHQLGSVVGFGRVGLSTPLVATLAEAGVSVALMSQHGRFLARVEGPASGNVLLRREQYRRADDGPAAAAIVRSIVAAKAANQRAVLRRALRDHGERLDAAGGAALGTAAERLGAIARRTVSLTDIDGLRGLEGEAASLYFGVLNLLIVAQGETFRLTTRSRRPPLDPLNAMLSFVYTLLTHDLRGALEGVGLDPAVGFLHRDRPGRPSLALDLVEELRPCLADRLVLSLINRRQIGPDGFRVLENGACLLTDDARRAVLVAWQERKQEELEHPFLRERIPFGLVPHVQAQLLARHLRGDLDGYPPFLWR